MRFHRRSLSKPRKLGVVAGGFNPPTIAHEELVYAAGLHVDEVLCVVPSVFPHKEFAGATLEQRLFPSSPATAPFTPQAPDWPQPSIY